MFDATLFENYRVQRKGDPVVCTVSCGDCNPCPPGVIQNGISNFFVEDKEVAYTGAQCSNCVSSGACRCCPGPNFILTGWFFWFFFAYRGLVRKQDQVTNGYFSGGAQRTFISGISTFSYNE